MGQWAIWQNTNGTIGNMAKHKLNNEQYGKHKWDNE